MMTATHTNALGIVREQRRHRALNVAAAGCLLLAVARLALTSVPEPMPWLSEAGELIYDLALAFLAGWIFHLLVVVAPEADRRARLDSIVAGRIDFLIRAGFTLAKPLARAADVDPEGFPLLPEAIDRACARVRPSDPPRGWAGDWHGLIRHLERITDVQRLAIKPFYARLGEDVLRLLDAEELEFTHLRRVNASSSRFELDDLSGLAEWISRWLGAVDALRAYRAEHLAPEVDAPQPGDDDS
jgi:hypothetical protein